MRRFAAAALALALTSCAGLPRVFRAADPLTAQEHARLGAAYDSQGLTAAAERQYLRALVLDPRHTGAWMALGNAAYAAGKYGRAARRYRRVLNLEPGHPGAANNLAMVYLAQNRRLSQARVLAESALANAGTLRPHILDTLEQIAKRQARPAPPAD
ncbi:MAG: tetratricopeptide repeat protein [Elusimicrobiota bacterium]|nr:tetratricopeptide repeat protein [Elusimicrobiota bacterium]